MVRTPFCMCVYNLCYNLGERTKIMLYRVFVGQLSECERGRYEHNLDEIVNVCDFVYHRQLNVLNKCKYIS